MKGETSLAQRKETHHTSSRGHAPNPGRWCCVCTSSEWDINSVAALKPLRDLAPMTSPAPSPDPFPSCTLSFHHNELLQLPQPSSSSLLLSTVHSLPSLVHSPCFLLTRGLTLTPILQVNLETRSPPESLLGWVAQPDFSHSTLCLLSSSSDKIYWAPTMC